MNFASSAEKIPLLRAPSGNRASPAQHGNWKSALAIRLQTPAQKRSARFNDLITKFHNNPHAISDEEELNGFVCECMFHGEVLVLSDVLSQETLPMLRIARFDDPDHHDDQVLALQTLRKALPDPSPIKGLSLKSRLIDGESCVQLFEILPALDSLHLDCCSVKSPWWGLPSCPQLFKLQHLRIENTHDAAPFLKKVLEASCRLKVLYLDSNYGLTVDDHQSFCVSLNKQQGIRELTLRQVRDTDPNCQRAIQCYATGYLASQTTLECLDLSGNLLTPDSCTALSKALAGKQLTSLSLASCWHYDESPEPLAQLVSQQSLVHLDLSGNQFGPSTAVVLEALASHPRLQNLNINLAMDDQLIGALVDLLANSKSITSLELPFLDDAHYDALLGAMRTNQTLRSLSIPAIERRRPQMTSEDFHERHRPYLALMDCIALNHERWKKQDDGN